MQEFETVLLSTEQHVATIRLNRPESLNAFTRQMRRDLHQALLEVSRMPEIRVVVLGAEGRGFSSGADLTEGPEAGQSVERQLLDEYLPIFTQIASMEQTVIAAVPGRSQVSRPVSMVSHSSESRLARRLRCAADMRLVRTSGRRSIFSRVSKRSSGRPPRKE